LFSKNIWYNWVSDSVCYRSGCFWASDFVEDIINPLIGLFIPAGNLDAVSIQVPNISGGTTEFRIGHLISSIIDFMIIALVVFLAYKQLSRFKLVDDKTIPEKK